MKVGVGIKPKTPTEEAIARIEPVVDQVCKNSLSVCACVRVCARVCVCPYVGLWLDDDVHAVGEGKVSDSVLREHSYLLRGLQHRASAVPPRPADEHVNHGIDLSGKQRQVEQSVVLRGALENSPARDERRAGLEPKGERRGIDRRRLRSWARCRGRRCGLSGNSTDRR